LRPQERTDPRGRNAPNCCRAAVRFGQRQQHRPIRRPHLAEAAGGSTLGQPLVPALGRLGQQEAEVSRVTTPADAACLAACRSGPSGTADSVGIGAGACASRSRAGPCHAADSGADANAVPAVGSGARAVPYSPGHAALGELRSAGAPAAVGRSRIGLPWLPCGRSRSPRRAGAPSTSTTALPDGNPGHPADIELWKQVSGLAPGVEEPVRSVMRLAFRAHSCRLVPAGSLAEVPPCRPGGRGLVARCQWCCVRCSACPLGPELARPAWLRGVVTVSSGPPPTS
jgi:hypothetical protein